MSATMDAELEEVMANLGGRDRQEVLEYARALLNGDIGEDDVPAEPRMMHFVSSISHGDLRRMRDAVHGDGMAGVIVVRFVGFIPEHELQEMRAAAGKPAARDGEESGEEASDADADEEEAEWEPAEEGDEEAGEEDEAGVEEEAAPAAA
jgi:hypothetical protein